MAETIEHELEEPELPSCQSGWTHKSKIVKDLLKEWEVGHSCRISFFCVLLHKLVAEWFAKSPLKEWEVGVL
jgi:hypothetical protein